MSKLKRELVDNLSGFFAKGSNEYRNLENGIDLFMNITEYITGNAKLDGISSVITNAITEIYINNKLTISPVKLLADSLEPYLKKIILLKNGPDFTLSNVDLVFLMKELELNRKLSNPEINPQLTIEKLDSYKNEPEYLYHLCKVHLIRNEVHNSPKWNLTEIVANIQSLMIIYLYSTIKYKNILTPYVSRHLDENIKADKYFHYINSILNYNLIFKFYSNNYKERNEDSIKERKFY